MKGTRFGSASATVPISVPSTNTNANVDTDVGSGSAVSDGKPRPQRSPTAKTKVAETDPYYVLTKPQLSHRPRPGHPLPLISFPSTAGQTGSNTSTPTDDNVTNPCTTTNSRGKLSGRNSTAKELLLGPQDETVCVSGNGDRDGWISSELPGAKYFRVPKPSHSAKKLAKPYSILVPPSANANTIAGRSTMSSYIKFRRNPSLSSVLGDDKREGNLPSATTPVTSSNNIDNKIVNKPRRNKTARTTTGLRKGLNNISIPKPTKPGLLSFSGSGLPSVNPKKANSASDFGAEQGQEIVQEQQSDLNVKVMSAGQWKVLSGGNMGNMSMAMSSVAKLNERVQVIRTAEEREQSPESIRMDGMGLKVFPYIGGGEGPDLKLLSLQRNLINRLENTPSTLNHLVVLDLYDNRLERITGLQGFTSLRVLLLGKNRIRRLEGLEGLKRLEILDLHGNQLRYVDNLGVLTALRVLNLAGNLLRSIRNLGPYGLSTLTELNLKRNRIRNLDGLVKAPHLKKLLLGNNDLQSSASLLPLRKLVFLQELLLEPNPLCSATDSRNQVLTMLSWLCTLDRSPVTDTMRSEARQWHKRKLVEEEERRKEEARLRAVSPTGGPPNSREQAIYQARRRWESVKNFVKNSNSKPTNPSSLSKANSSGGGGGTVRSQIDDEFGSETLSRSQNSSKELLEYPGGEVRLNLAQLGLDLDQPDEPILVSSLSSSEKPFPQQEDPCPPSMINDHGPPHPQDYVNTNSSLPKQVVLGLGPSDGSDSRDLDQQSSTSLLTFHQPPMDSSIITNIIKKAESTQSPLPGCQQPSQWNEGDGDGFDGKKLHRIAQDIHNDNVMESEMSTSLGNPGVEKAMRIAVVRPLLREPNLDETIPSTLHPNSDNSTSLQSASLFESSYSDNQETFKKVDNYDYAPDLDQEKDALNHKFNSNHSLQSNLSFQELSYDRFNPGNEITPNPNSLSISDTDYDKIINSNKNESGTPPGKDGIFKRNMLRPLRRSVSTCLLPTPSELCEEEVETCPTFETPTEHCINNGTDINMNMTLASGTSKNGESGCTTTTAGGSTTTISTATATPSSPGIDRVNASPNLTLTWRNKSHLRKLRSASFDGRLPSSTLGSDDEHYDDDDDDKCSIGTGSTTTTATTSEISPRTKPGFSRKQLFQRTKSQRLKLQDRAARVQSSSSVTSRIKSGTGLSPGSGVNRLGPGDIKSNKQMRRCDSAVAVTGTCPLENGSNISSGPLKRQGTDYLVEIDGKVLSIYGQGALKHTLTGFPGNVTCLVTTAKFHYISYDSIIPYFGKLRQIYPSLEHFQFRANNIGKLSQLNALSDLQGLTSLHVVKEGNPLVSLDSSWVHYASYRLSHWGLQNVNGKEVSYEYRGGHTTTSKCFESLGFLALSCLPQTALTPLAKRLHMLHCFCCCSPSSSSDESGKGKTGKALKGRPGSPQPPEQQSSSSGNICTSWDDDPVLLDVIGKEALVYCPFQLQRTLSPPSSQMNEEIQGKSPPIPSLSSSLSEMSDRKRMNTLVEIVDSGVEVLEKLDMLEESWPSLMTEIIQEILMDYKFMDNYMKKELKKCHDATTIALHNTSKKGNH